MIRRLARFLPPLAACAVLALPDPARAVENIPFTDDGGLIKVQASVDGQTPVPMLVDLGAGVNVLSARMAHLVAINGKYTTLRLTGDRVDLPMGNVVSLALGGVRIADTHVGVWRALSDVHPVDGLISATAFRDTATTFDFRNHQIVIEDAVSYPERRRVATRVPLILQDDMNTALALFARFDFGNGRSGLCLIDTGSKEIRVDKVFERGGVPSLTMEGAPQTAISKPNVTFDNLIYDCVVGTDFWGGRTFTLDVLNKALYVAQQS